MVRQPHRHRSDHRSRSFGGARHTILGGSCCSRERGTYRSFQGSSTACFRRGTLWCCLTATPWPTRCSPAWRPSSGATTRAPRTCSESASRYVRPGQHVGSASAAGLKSQHGPLLKGVGLGGQFRFRLEVLFVCRSEKKQRTMVSARRGGARERSGQLCVEVIEQLEVGTTF